MLYVRTTASGVVVAVVDTHVDDFLLAHRIRDAPFRAVADTMDRELHVTRRDVSVFAFCGKAFTSFRRGFWLTALKPSVLLRFPWCRNGLLLLLGLGKNPLRTIPQLEVLVVLFLGLGEILRQPFLFAHNAIQAPQLQMLVGWQSRVNNLRGLFNMIDTEFTAIAWGDSASANAHDEQLECGEEVGLTIDPKRVLGYRVEFGMSTTIKRIVRSTLAAEGYSYSEVVERSEYI